MIISITESEANISAAAAVRAGRGSDFAGGLPSLGAATAGTDIENSQPTAKVAKRIHPSVHSDQWPGQKQIAPVPLEDHSNRSTLRPPPLDIHIQGALHLKKTTLPEQRSPTQRHCHCPRDRYYILPTVRRTGHYANHANIGQYMYDPIGQQFAANLHAHS